MPTATIIVTGSNGQLGSEMKELSPDYPQFRFVFLSREAFPINDEEKAKAIFEEYKPDYFINCAAYTAVDKAESEMELASDINGNAVGTLAALCKKHDTKFIHISTDYVFNGNNKEPLKETDDTDPVNAYGASKLLGEYKAEKNNPESIIFRTSWVYSAYGKNFVKTMMKLMNERASVGVVNDQFGSPTYAADLAEAIMKIISSGKWEPGLYNYSNEGVISWFEFASEIKSQIGSSCVVNPITTEQFPTPAKRPKYSVLDKTKIKDVYHLSLKEWKDSLRTCISKLKITS